MEVVLGRGSGSLTGPLTDGTCVRQSFVARASELESVAIFLSTYKRVNPGTVILELLDKGRSKAKCVFPASELVDNAYCEFPLVAPLIEGCEYELRLSTMHCRSGMSPTAHYGPASSPGYMFIGPRSIRKSELVCKMKYSEGMKSVTVPMASDASISKFVSQGEPRVSVIVLNKDRPELISKCVEALEEYADVAEVIIGDTGSTDERTMAVYEGMPENFRVRWGLDYHFSKNNNELAQEATGTHLIFLNNDVFLEEGCVERMLEYSMCYKVGAVGLRLIKERGVIDHDGQILWDDRGIRTPDHENVNRLLSDVDSEDSVTQGVTAACVLIRRDVFDSVGGFDETYEDVYQDCDLCLNLVSNGYSCITVRSKSAVHVGSATRGPTTRERESVSRDREKYKKKWKGFYLPAKPLFSFVTCCNDTRQYMAMMRTVSDRDCGAVEMIPVVNPENMMSITRALNIGRMVSSGRWKVYCHQDVLYPSGWVRDMRGFMLKLSKKSNVGVVGFEGLARGGVPYSCKRIKKGGYVKIQTLDELCLVTPGDMSFDEDFRYHYYGADFCLSAETAGMTNYLVGLPVEHLSGGKSNILKDVDGFKEQAEDLRKKWSDFDFYTTTTKFEKGKIYYMILPEVLNED